jgi:HEAT repeat protein
VASTLGRFGPAAAPAVPELSRVLQDAVDRKQSATAARIAGALGRIDPKSPAAIKAIPILVEALQSPRNRDPRDPKDAADALGHFGPVAVEAVPGLIAMFTDEHTALRERAPAARALGRIAPGTPQAEPAGSALIESLPAIQKHPGEYGNLEVFEALARFGPKAAEAIPQLRELAKSRNPEVGEAARKALGAIEGPSR